MTTCPDCRSIRTKKIQFIQDDFLHMQTIKEAVATAVRLKTKSSISAEKVVEEVEIIYGIKRSTIATKDSLTRRTTTQSRRCGISRISYRNSVRSSR